MQNLLLIDGDNLLRRYYEVLDDRLPDRADQAARRCFGAVKRNLEEFPPTHAVVAFDAQGRKWRHRLFPDYKAHRPSKPQELIRQTDRLIRQLGRQLGVSAMRIEGNEADDVIAHLAMDFVKRPEAVVRIVSTDKDFAALIGPSIEIYDPFERTVRWLQYPVQKWGVTPHQVHDLLALMGDKSDGVPGVPRIGVVTAAKLLAKYGSIEGILASSEEDAQQVCAHADLARLSLALVQFRCDPELKPIEWHELRHVPPEPTAAPDARTVGASLPRPETAHQQSMSL